MLNATAAFNQTIEALAQQYNLGFVDANGILRVLSDTGIPLSDGSLLTSTYATGGAFSLDGVHPSPRGSAIIANAFLEAMANRFGSVLREIDPLEYTGLYLN